MNLDEFPLTSGKDSERGKEGHGGEGKGYGYGRPERRNAARQGWLESELKCWRCGKGFGNKFARLKEHLEEEFLEWRAE